MEKEFGKLRALIWPIHGHELKRFLPMGLMMFFILFNYNILRDTKDTLVVNAAGGEALSLIKLVGTVPGAILIMLLYSKLSTIFTREKLFYLVIFPFILFFGLFAFVIYPNRDLLHPSSELVQRLSLEYPRFKTAFHVYGSWSYGLFYVFSELWGSVVLSLLFWQLANDSVAMKDAKRFYPLFGVLGNVGLIAAGLAVQHFSEIRGKVAPHVDPWGMTLNYLMGAIVLGGVMVMLIHYWINKNRVEQVSAPKKEKLKMSLKESFLFLIRSKHLGLIALVLICYGISINVIEAVWKDQIRFAHGSENAYNAFMGKYTVTTGVVTILFMFIGSNIVRLFGWFVSALLTPLMIFATGVLFFGFVSFKNQFELMTLTLLSMTPTALAVWLGFYQGILSKATKYSLFDPTKEMCYIPLDQESKMKGKAAVDVVGGRLGKSGGSIIQQFLLLTTGSSLVQIAPYLAIIMMAVVIAWIFSAKALHKSLQSATALT